MAFFFKVSCRIVWFSTLRNRMLAINLWLCFNEINYILNVALIFLRSSKIPRRLKVCFDFFSERKVVLYLGSFGHMGSQLLLSLLKTKSNIFTADSKILYCIKHLGRTWLLGSIKVIQGHESWTRISNDQCEFKSIMRILIFYL